jgi:hypothetical protein
VLGNGKKGLSLCAARKMSDILSLLKSATITEPAPFVVGSFAPAGKHQTVFLMAWKLYERGEWAHHATDYASGGVG